jgi:hypothetical protein
MIKRLALHPIALPLMAVLHAAAPDVILAAATVPQSGHVSESPLLRRASLSVESIESRAGLVLEEPAIVDTRAPSAAGAAVRHPRIERFEFTIRKIPEGLEDLQALMTIEARDGVIFEGRAVLSRPAAGDLIQVPVGKVITRDLEGPSRARLTLTGEDGRVLFEGTYGFGYPRYETIREMRRIHDGAPIREDFRSGVIDETRWRIWLEDPDRVSMEVRDGRLWIHAEDRVGYNGLVSRTSMETRDVEAVCLAGAESARGGQHPALVHLCGTSKMSPDNWFELRLQDGGDNRAVLSTLISAPPRSVPEQGHMDLPGAASDGYLVKIISDPSARRVHGLVKVDDVWRQVGEALEVPARAARLEIKTEGFRKNLTTTTLWFDDCRVYPRPQTHYVTVALQRPGGGHPGGPGRSPWPLAIFDEANTLHTHDGIFLRLYTEDGETVVDETQPGGDLAYAMFSLEGAPWDTYPVAARIRIFLGDRQLGEDLVIERSGVEGLYPDDIYLVTLE